MHRNPTLSLLAVSAAQAAEPAAAIMTATKARMGMVPYMYGRMANAPALLHTYSVGYEEFRREGGFSPAEQETVFLTISRENQCDYCMAAHSYLADRVSGVTVANLAAIREGRTPPDARLAALSDFTSHLLHSRGRPDKAAVEAFLSAGFSQVQVLYLVLAIAVKTISNYANHLFETPVDAIFADHAWAAVV